MNRYKKDYVPFGAKLKFVKITTKPYHKEGDKRIYEKALYVCECGRMVELITANVYRGKTKSCGCNWGRWTEAQDKILINNFPDISKICLETGKTATSVGERAKKLKLFYAPSIDIWYQNVPVEIRAYLAGNFDGEGCAAFRKRKKCRAPILMVCIANRPVIEVYKKYFNGSLDDHKLKVKENHKKMYRWRCVGYEDIYNFILSTIPFSIEKREQLLCLKEYIDVYLKNGKKASFDNEFRELSERLHLRCTELKKV